MNRMIDAGLSGVERPIGFFKHKLVSFVMLCAAGLLLAASLVLIGAVEVAREGRGKTVLVRECVREPVEDLGLDERGARAA